MHTRKLDEMLSNIANCQDKTVDLLLVAHTSGPSVSDSDTARIVDAIKANEKIKHLSLRLSHVKIDAKNIAGLIQAVPGDIVSLDLDNIDLNEAGLSNIYNSLKDKRINQLELSYRRARSLDGYQSLMKIIQNNFSGFVLSLRGLNMPPPVIIQLSDILKDKEELNYLEISRNTIGNDIFKVIRHTRATDCFISNCQLQGKKVGSLLKEVITQNPHVHSLGIEGLTDEDAILSLRGLSTSELNSSRLVFLFTDSERAELSWFSDFSKEQEPQAHLENEFLLKKRYAFRSFVEENESELIKDVSKLTAAFEALKLNHHKNLDMLTDDYYKFMFEYFLSKNEIEQAVTSLVRIRDKTKRIKGLIDDLFPDLMCAVSTPMTAVEKRQWQFVLLCTLECPDPGFISIKANALSVLLTGKNALVNNASDYCATILKDKNAQQVMMEVGSLRQACLAREQTVIENVDHLSVDAFWQEQCINPESLNKALMQRVDNLEQKVELLYEMLEKQILNQKNSEPQSTSMADSSSRLGLFNKGA